MELPKECYEVFLEDITDIFIYKKVDVRIPMPATIPGVTEIKNCTFGTSALHIAYFFAQTEGEETFNAVAEDNTMVAKTNISHHGGLTLYNIEVSATIEIATDEVQAAFLATDGEDCVFVVKQSDGTLHLCHSLPGTFRMDIPTSGAHPVMSFRASATAYSPLIAVNKVENT